MTYRPSAHVHRPTRAAIREAAEHLGISTAAVHRRRYSYRWTWAEAMETPRHQVPERLLEPPPPITYPRATRMLAVGQRREAIVDCIDTGRRDLVEEPCEHLLALVHVAGEREPRWVAAELLEPDGPDEHAAWLAEIEVTRPVESRSKAARPVGPRRAA